MAVNFCTIYFIPLYFQFVHGDGALIAAVRLLPYIALNVATNLAIGHFWPRIQYYMPVYVISGIISTLASGLLMRYLKPSTSQGVIYGLLVLLGIGSGMSISMGFSISTFKVKPSDIGNAISFQDVCQLGSSTIGLVIAGRVFRSRAIANLEHVLAGKGFSSTDIRDAVAGAQSTLFKELSGNLKLEATNAITEALQKTFALTVVGGAVMILAGACMRFETAFDVPPKEIEEKKAPELLIA
ncbi:Efflux pump patC [Cladobotryum mycophilum]|uniref:Efflux pump patC n=1 Tax=Cladobotryum mycophilum TaxID=491253 RepID=A0ABR0SQ74_9HYPO